MYHYLYNYIHLCDITPEVESFGVFTFNYVSHVFSLSILSIEVADSCHLLSVLRVPGGILDPPDILLFDKLYF